MKQKSGLSGYLNRWVMLSSILLTVILISITAFGMSYLRGSMDHLDTLSTAEVVVIPGATATTVYLTPTPKPTATATIWPPSPVNSEVIVKGVYVQISGTEGDGLRLRESPGTSANPLFLGDESEVFVVMDGPETANDITWWYLASPSDQTRAGWAAANYLTVIQNP